MPNDVLESGNQPGTPGQPTQAASGPSSAKPTSAPAGDMPDWALRLEKRLDDLARTAQGDKDRAVAKVVKELETWRPVLEKAKAYLTPEQAAQMQRDLEWDEIKSRVLGSEPAQPAAATPGAGTADPVEKALRKYGLDINDAEVVQALRESADPFDRVAALAALSVKRQSAPQPSPAVNAAPVSGAQVARTLSGSDVESKAAELRALYKNPTQNRARISALEKELEPYFK